jgi:hypothetical protein
LNIIDFQCDRGLEKFEGTKAAKFCQFSRGRRCEKLKLKSGKSSEGSEKKFSKFVSLRIRSESQLFSLLVVFDGIELKCKTILAKKVPTPRVARRRTFQVKLIAENSWRNFPENFSLTF